MAQRYVWIKRHGKYIDTHQRRAMRLLVRIAGENEPLCTSGGFPSGFQNDRRSWMDFQRAEAYKWFLRGSFTSYRYY